MKRLIVLLLFIPIGLFAQNTVSIFKGGIPFTNDSTIITGDTIFSYTVDTATGDKYYTGKKRAVLGQGFVLYSQVDTTIYGVPDSALNGNYATDTVKYGLRRADTLYDLSVDYLRDINLDSVGYPIAGGTYYIDTLTFGSEIDTVLPLPYYSWVEVAKSSLSYNCPQFKDTAYYDYGDTIQTNIVVNDYSDTLIVVEGTYNVRDYFIFPRINIPLITIENAETFTRTVENGSGYFWISTYDSNTDNYFELTPYDLGNGSVLLKYEAFPGTYCDDTGYVYQNVNFTYSYPERVTDSLPDVMDMDDNNWDDFMNYYIASEITNDSIRIFTLDSLNYTCDVRSKILNQRESDSTLLFESDYEGGAFIIDTVVALPSWSVFECYHTIEVIGDYSFKKNFKLPVLESLPLVSDTSFTENVCKRQIDHSADWSSADKFVIKTLQPFYPFNLKVKYFDNDLNQTVILYSANHPTGEVHVQIIPPQIFFDNDTEGIEYVFTSLSDGTLTFTIE